MKTRKAEPPCKTLLPWLRANLGKRCLAPLTGTDARALAAAVQIAELWTVADERRPVAAAFGLVVGSSMQASTQYLAYHAIAHVGDWSFRRELWEMAGLPPIHPRLCAFEPGGSRIDQSKL